MLVTFNFRWKNRFSTNKMLLLVLFRGHKSYYLLIRCAWIPSRYNAKSVTKAFASSGRFACGISVFSFAVSEEWGGEVRGLGVCDACIRNLETSVERNKKPSYFCTFSAIVSSTLALKSYPRATWPRSTNTALLLQLLLLPAFDAHSCIKDTIHRANGIHNFFYLCLLFLQLIYILSPFVWILLWLFFILLRLLD